MYWFVLYGLGLITFVISFLYFIHKAPMGYQTKNGFHRGEPSSVEDEE